MTEHPSSESQPTAECTDTSDTANARGLLFFSDVQALRMADTVSLHTTTAGGVIHADLSALNGDEPRIYTAKQQHLFPDAVERDRRRNIDVAADITGYDTQRRWHEHHLPGATAHTTLTRAHLNDAWRTITAFLRVGDILRLRWHCDNRSDDLTRFGLHRDDLAIVLNRGSRTWTFQLHVVVRPQHHRMITTASS